MFEYEQVFDQWVTNKPNPVSKYLSAIVKACVGYFLSNFYFSPNDSPSKTMKMFYTSFKKPFPFSRYSNFCNIFPLFPHFPDLKGQMKVE